MRPATDEIFRMAFEVEADFCFHIGFKPLAVKQGADKRLQADEERPHMLSRGTLVTRRIELTSLDMRDHLSVSDSSCLLPATESV